MAKVEVVGTLQDGDLEQELTTVEDEVDYGVVAFLRW
jgi:hypothetical protein